MIDLALSLLEKGAPRPPSKCVSCSSLGYCSRRIGYKLLQYPAMDAPASLMWVLKLGNAIHDMLQSELVHMGWVKARPYFKEDGTLDWAQLPEDPMSGCELRALDEDRKLSGFCDGVTVPLMKTTKHGQTSYVPHPDGKRYLVEIKSITDSPSFWVIGIKDGGRDTISESNCPSEFIEIDYEEKKGGKPKQKLYNFLHARPVLCKFGKRGTTMKPVYRVKSKGEDLDVTVLYSGNSAGSFTSLVAPKPDHTMQASAYCSMLTKKFGAPIKDILFMYVGKDVKPNTYDEPSPFNVPVKLFDIPADPDVDYMIDMKVGKIFAKVDNNELPDREYTPDTFECKDCPYLWDCYPEVLPASEVLAMAARKS